MRAVQSLLNTSTTTAIVVSLVYLAAAIDQTQTKSLTRAFFTRKISIKRNVLAASLSKSQKWAKRWNSRSSYRIKTNMRDLNL